LSEGDPVLSIPIKKMNRIACVLLMPLAAVFLWCWIIRHDHYFPGRYEDAFVATFW